MTLRYQIFVSGRVQRVSFRAHTCEKGTALGLTGRATNRSDGRVEVWAQGPKAALEELVAWLHKGPLLARVDDVTYVEVEPLDEPEAAFSRH